MSQLGCGIVDVGGGVSKCTIRIKPARLLFILTGEEECRKEKKAQGKRAYARRAEEASHRPLSPYIVSQPRQGGGTCVATLTGRLPDKPAESAVDRDCCFPPLPPPDARARGKHRRITREKNRGSALARAWRDRGRAGARTLCVSAGLSSLFVDVRNRRLAANPAIATTARERAPTEIGKVVLERFGGISRRRHPEEAARRCQNKYNARNHIRS